MSLFRRKSLIAQISEHLRRDLAAGRWHGQLPGVRTLAEHLGVSKDTVRAALRILERENVLRPGGAGKRRCITSRNTEHRSGLRVAILLDEHLHTNNAHSLELILMVKQAVEAAGHACTLCEKSLKQIPGIPRLARFVRNTKADAWIIYSAPREVLEWFSGNRLATLAIGGRCLGLPIASVVTDVKHAMADAVDALVALAHTRIVMVCGSLWRDPSPGPSAGAFLERLQWHGLPVSEYNLPSWQETPEGLHAMLISMFAVTPPTALIITEPSMCVSIRIYLAERGLTVPRDISMVSLLPDPALCLHRPAMAQFKWPLVRIVDRATAWVDRIAHGADDRRATVFRARFRPAETLAEARPRIRS